MQYILSLLCFVVLGTNGFSQISINEADFANPGDTVRFSQTLQTSNDPSITGVNYSWDFSNLDANSQFVREYTAIGFSPVQLTFGIFAPQNYQASYFIPENTLPVDQLNGFLPISLSDARSYQKSTIDSITKVGFSVKVGGVDVAFKSDTIETKYKFPMDFQQLYSTKGYTFIDLNPAADFKIKQHRYISSTIDGYGELILPFGTFQVLRLKREINEVDSIYQSFFGMPSWFEVPPFQITEYEWISQNKKDVLLKIVVNNTNGGNQVQSIEYQDINLNLNAELLENNFQASVFPNPTSNKINITASSDIKDISFYDATGVKLMQFENVNSSEFVLDLERFAPGFYFISIQNSLGSKTILASKN